MGEGWSAHDGEIYDLESEEYQLSHVICSCLIDYLFFYLVLLYIHRSYFAKVLLRHPRNPLQSPYAPSFLSAFRCSLSILHLIRDCHEQNPKLLLRSWLVCKHAFSALVSFIHTIHLKMLYLTLACALLDNLRLGGKERAKLEFGANCFTGVQLRHEIC